MKKQHITLLITLLAFGLYFLVDEQYFSALRTWINGFINQIGISHILAYLIVGIPIFIGVLYLHGKNKWAESLGLDQPIVKGLLFSLLCTLPMFVGYGIVFSFNTEFSLNHLLVTVIAAALFEELYFRGFLFGQLYRYTNWGFIPSVLIGAILFGIVHLYQGTQLNELIGIFTVTFMGAVLYAWVYVEWNYNLWVPIFLHLFMNLSWGLFSAGDSALGGMYANLFRSITIALIIILTIRYKRRNNKKLAVNRKTFWVKKPLYQEEQD